jgi:hypothetical protein
MLVMSMITFLAYPFLSGDGRKHVAPLGAAVDEIDDPEDQEDDDAISMEDDDDDDCQSDQQLKQENQSNAESASDPQILDEKDKQGFH